MQRDSETGGHDIVIVGDGNDDGAADCGEIGDAVIAIAQQQLDRQQGVVMGCDVLPAGPMA